MSSPDEDIHAPALVRAYVISSGTDLNVAGSQLHLDTAVTVSGRQLPLSAPPEKQHIWELVSEGYLPVTQIAGYMKLPLGVVVALLVDMLDDEHLVIRHTAQLAQNNVGLLKEVLHGLRAL